MNRYISRRDFLKLAGGAVVTVTGASLLPQFLRKTLLAEQVASAANGDPDLFWAGTDGWFWLPADSSFGSMLPDALAPEYIAGSPLTTYIFGFRNVTDMTDTQRQNQRNKAQHSAPFFWVDEYDDALNNEFRVQLTNLGLALRPDLTDNHTLHWHGFRNVIPFFDGEPTGSVAVPVGQRFTYVYRPRDPGTYMYHCHVEDIEHVTMGMTGIVFVRPKQNGTAIGGFTKFAYNDGDGSTGYHREFALFLSEVWILGHWNDAHIQESDWSLFKADFSLLNGRVYPDTLLPNSPVDMTVPSAAHSVAFQIEPPDATGTRNGEADVPIEGDLKTNPGLEHLQFQPHSALVTCNAGERVLLRFANLGFRESAMTLAGIPMKVVGRDATPMKGRDGTDTSYMTDTLLFGAGESFDAIFTAPAYSGGAGSSGLGYDTYMLYNRRYTQESATHGQRTEVRVYAPGTLPAQRYLNQHPGDNILG